MELWDLIGPDGRRLFLARVVRLFAYGMLAVVLAVYLAGLGLSDGRIGLLLSLTLLGDTVLSLFLTFTADRRGRRVTLLLGAMLMVGAALVFGRSVNFWVLLLAAIIGVISPGGNEVGPFLAVEQASLAELIGEDQRTRVFAYYNMAGSLAGAAGSLFAGVLVQSAQTQGMATLQSLRLVIWGYGLAGVVLLIIFHGLSRGAERRRIELEAPTGLNRSRGVVAKLSSLFALDAFAGGFVVQTWMAYWFYVRFGAAPADLGGIFFTANVLSGFSSLAAVGLARRIGLVKTMVFTHLPSNLLLLLVPLMPSLASAVAVLWFRYSISQMDVPTRQAYLAKVVDPEERAAAAGVTGVARNLGAALPPFITGYLMARPETRNLPFFLAGSLKCVYDLLLFWNFVHMESPPHKGETQ